MDERFTIERQDHAILVMFEPGSEVSPEMIMGALDRENERFEIQGRYHIWDFRSCRPSEDFDYDAVLRIIGHVQTQYNDEWSAKTAILVDQDLQFGLSRMFEALVDSNPTEIGIFYDASVANEWIRQNRS
jgi:hypothetical protein